MKVLYVEDEKLLAEAVVFMLKSKDIDVDWVDDGEKALELTTNPKYDAIILDIMLPKISGLEILKIVRQRNIKTPIIILSALGEVEDKIRGLDFGADDYLAKPFKTSELIARLNAIVRRPPLVDSKKKVFADLELNLSEHTVNNIELTNKEMKILDLLMNNSEKVIPKERILSYAWNDDSVRGEENYAEVYISYLRKKLQKTQSKVKIKTVRGLGYKLTNVS